MTRNKTYSRWLVALMLVGFLLQGCSQTKLYRGVYDSIIKGTGDAVHDAVFDLINGIVGMQGQGS